MTESVYKLNHGTIPESGAEMTIFFSDKIHHYYCDDSSLIVQGDGTRVARDSNGKELGKSTPTPGQKILIIGLASSSSVVILRDTPKPKRD